MAILEESKEGFENALGQEGALDSVIPHTCNSSSKNSSFLSTPEDQQSQTQTPRRITLFSNLATEIHIELMDHLDPVSQMCLGLTSRYFHRVFHTIHNHGPFLEYNIKRYHFSLRMQASVCGGYVLNWIWENWGLIDSDDILWHSSLGDLLSDDKTLWGDLRCCSECQIYKPESAYERFAVEETFFETFKREIDTLERENVEWYLAQCQRCRARVLLTTFGKRKVVLEDGHVWEERKSLGLQRSEVFREESIEEKEYRALLGEYQAGEQDYESWEEVFEGLGI